MQTILIGVTSGIAAYKVIKLVKNLRKKNFNVIVIMTEHAKKMLSVADFEKASGNKVASSLFPKDFDYKKILKKRKVDHISLADKADLIAIAPATANIIAKVANGVADDLLSTTILASKASLLFCPSMNVNMWNKKVTQKNLRMIKKKGGFFIGPESGMLACGYEGKGRLADVDEIENEIIKLVSKREELKGKGVLVTAGGTEEEIDDARVITNKSSGKMGIIIAEEFVKRGAEVTLIRGRTSVEPRVMFNDIRVKNVDDMYRAIKKNIMKNGIIVHAAAVSDFKVKKTKGKISSKDKMVLELVPTIKIIDQIKKIKKDIFLVGFKAEYDKKSIKKKAFDSLKRTQANLFVSNDISKGVFGSDYNEVMITDEIGKTKKIKKAKKNIIAEKIVDEIVMKI